MRIFYCSDLHLEWAPLQMSKIDADVVVLAGDIAEGANGVHWAAAAFGCPVVYVPGNHEFYGRERRNVLAEMQTACRETQVTILDNQSFLINGVRFLGCTLWSDFNLLGAEACDWVMSQCARKINDFSMIRENGESFTPGQAAALFAVSRDWLKGSLDEPYLGTTVVVTHHAPHRDSLPGYWVDDPLSGAFCSDISDLLGRSLLWIHGHLHNSADYVVQGTRVVCNPRGYVGQGTNFAFDERLVVEVPDLT